MRPIDADELATTFIPALEMGYKMPINTIMDAIQKAPTLDVQPVIHAHWERDTTFDGFKVWKCSNCACRFNYISTEWGLSPATYAYGIRCGHCGAVMDK